MGGAVGQRGGSVTSATLFAYATFVNFTHFAPFHQPIVGTAPL
jgi:hypothetical protein